jgi:hypothetical protein
VEGGLLVGVVDVVLGLRVGRGDGDGAAVPGHAGDELDCVVASLLPPDDDSVVVDGLVLVVEVGLPELVALDVEGPLEQSAQGLLELLQPRARGGLRRVLGLALEADEGDLLELHILSIARKWHTDSSERCGG